MNSRILKILAIVAVTALVAGCKLAVMVPSGGNVTSLSGTRDCNGGSFCEFDVTDTNFSESFTAIASPGYQFIRWQKGTDFLCGDSKNLTCTVNLSGNAALDSAIIALFDRLYIMPIFKNVGYDPDGDGIRNELDEDDDNDGVLDTNDSCPLIPNPDCTLRVADPDTVYVPGAIEIDNAFTGVTLSTNVDNRHVLSNGAFSPGSSWYPSVFGHGAINFPTGGCSACWSFGFAELRADFSEPAHFVSIDFLDAEAGTAKLEAYSSTGVLLGVSTATLVGRVGNAEPTGVTVGFFDPSGSISYVLAGAETGIYGMIDKLAWY